MSRKVDKNNPNYRPNNPRRRHFAGNQYRNADKTERQTSTSVKKLKTSLSEDVQDTETHCYRIIEFFSVFNAIAEIVMCIKCKQKMEFNESGNRGLGFKITIKCQCGRSEISSGPFISNSYEINRRIVFVMRMLGVTRQGINLFCGLMDLGQGLSQSTYDTAVKYVYEAAKIVWFDARKKAIEEEKKKNEELDRPINNLKVSGDGSWKRRGFSSLFGVTTLIGYYTGKVVDFVVKGSYCQACTYWKKWKNTEEYQLWSEDHANECQINHGPKNKMEIDSMVEMFSKSEEQFGVKYTTYIGDGDAETFKAISNIQPYGPEFPISKSECVEHVEKRMGSRLRSVKKSAKLEDKLTDALIKKMTTYYGIAIRDYSESVEEMKKAIMATFHHMISTNANPKHDDCPSGENSWCEYRVAKAAGTSYAHPPSLHPDVQKYIKPIYEEFSHEDLLRSCLEGHAQNPNESFNFSVWRLAPKHLNCGLKIIEMASFLAAGVFNEGYNFILHIMQQLDITIGYQCKLFCTSYNDERIHRQERRIASGSGETKTVRKEERTSVLDGFEEKEEFYFEPEIEDEV